MTQNIDEPLSELRSSKTNYYSQDGLGIVTSLTTSAGALDNTYTSDSWIAGVSVTSKCASHSRSPYLDLRSFIASILRRLSGLGVPLFGAGQ
jgi:hypothetical protein